jgi:hypothetical protein
MYRVRSAAAVGGGKASASRISSTVGERTLAWASVRECPLTQPGQRPRVLYPGIPLHAQRRELAGARTEDDYTVREWVVLELAAPTYLAHVAEVRVPHAVVASSRPKAVP